VAADGSRIGIGIPAGLGEVIESDALAIKVKVERKEVPGASAWLLRNLAVADLAIEEEDIGSVIEALMKRESV
jgi:hypothetical protein